MGRRLDVLLGRTTKQTARLRSLLGLAATRLGMVWPPQGAVCAGAQGRRLLCLGCRGHTLARA